VAGKVPQTLEELRAKTQYQPTNDPLGRSQTTAQKIVNRLLDHSNANKMRGFFTALRMTIHISFKAVCSRENFSNREPT